LCVQEEALDRKLTTIDCQLKKSERSRKQLEVSNKRLLGFAQVPLDQVYLLRSRWDEFWCQDKVLIQYVCLEIRLNG